MSLFASGKRALGICDICGFTYLLNELRSVIRKGVDTNLKACPTCWEADHPQYHIGEVRVIDPQALRNPRPDSAQLASSRAIKVFPASGATTCTTFLGLVTVQVS